VSPKKLEWWPWPGPDNDIWIACEHPERPVDGKCAWHPPVKECRACAIHLQVAVVKGLVDPDDEYWPQYEELLSGGGG
jgi:hypothetical protein